MLSNVFRITSRNKQNLFICNNLIRNHFYFNLNGIEKSNQNNNNNCMKLSPLLNKNDFNTKLKNKQFNNSQLSISNNVIIFNSLSKWKNILIYLSILLGSLTIDRILNLNCINIPLKTAYSLEQEVAKEAEEDNLINNEPVRKKKKIGFRERRIIEYENRLRAFSTPEKIFRYFATLKVAGDESQVSMTPLASRFSDIYMTPEDFVRSITPGVMQPKNLGLDKYQIYHPDKHKHEFSDKKSIFYKLGEHGLINYHDYLFLLTLISTPPQEFLLAFKIFDLNGDGELDEEEFFEVQELVLSQTMVGQGIQRSGSIGCNAKKCVNSALTLYFFGKDGKQKLSIEKFLKFQAQLHRDILKIEFERRDPESYKEDKGVISEVSFSELLLIHACLTEKRKKRMMKRVKKAYKNKPDKVGVTWDEVVAFFHFLYYIDEVDLSLEYYKLAGASLNKKMIKKVAQKVANVELTDNVVDIVITLFDEDNDGCLSHKEFISVMKERVKRGLESPRDTGLFRFFDALSSCIKQQWDFINVLIQMFLQNKIITIGKVSIKKCCLLSTQAIPITTTQKNGDINLRFEKGLPIVTVPLPSRKELCQFILRPVSDNVGTLCNSLSLEDKGIDFVAAYSIDGTRIANSTSIEHLLLFEKFNLRINDFVYTVVIPNNKNDYSLKTNEKAKTLDDLKLLIASLHASLNLEDFKISREKQLLKQLEKVTIELKPLEIIKNHIERECDKRSERVLWSFFMFLGLETGIFARLTWWEYSWDIMEPITYFATHSTVIGTFAYYLITRQPFEYSTLHGRTFSKKFHKLAKKYNFDYKKYNALKEHEKKINYDLERLRDPLNQQLPFQCLNTDDNILDKFKK
uniref:EF-hand domain-containing protein n=1 Tax=Strongyloides stercoralis TaxID=6248 RepID=A0AAF5DL13_STRER